MKTTTTMITVITAALALIAAPALPAAAPKEKDEKAQGEAKKEPLKPYKLDTCLVSGEKLGSMGDPVVFAYQGQEIKLCCKSCKPKFDKDPEKYLKKLAEK